MGEGERHRARRQGLEFTVKDLLGAQSVASLARVVGQRKMRKPAEESVTGAFELTPLARAYLEGARYPEHFNQSVLIEPEGRLDIGHLRTALDVLVAHHDALRADRR